MHFLSQGFLFLTMSKTFPERFSLFVAWNILTVLFLLIFIFWSFLFRWSSYFRFKGFSHYCEQMVFHWSTNDNKSPRVSKTLLSILSHLNNVVLMVSILSFDFWLFQVFFFFARFGDHSECYIEHRNPETRKKTYDFLILYTHNHNDTTKKKDKRRLLKKICTSHFIVTFVCERELETEQNCNILTPTLIAISVVSFSFYRAAQPEAQGPSSLLDDGFLYCILSPTGLQNSIGGPESPFGRVWLSLPHLVSDVSHPQLIRGFKGPFRRAFSTTSLL